MHSQLPPRAHQQIRRHVDELLAGLELSPESIAEARADFAEHLEQEALSQMASGADPDTAVARALARLGGEREIREHLAAWSSGDLLRPPRGAAEAVGSLPASERGLLRTLAVWVEDLGRDAGFALRSAMKEPGVAATMILTIALGVAATTTVFAVVDGVLLRGLAYPDPGRLVSVWPTFWFSNSNFSTLEEDLSSSGADVFAAIAGYSPRSVHYRTDAGTRSVLGLHTTARFFDVLGAEMTAGGTFAPDANQPGESRVVVLSHGFWQRELAGDAAVVGAPIYLDGEEHTVLGVLAPGYDLFWPEVELVVPKTFDPDHVRYRSAEMKALGRLLPGATIEQADAALQAVLAGWRERFDLDDDFGERFRPVPLHEQLVGDLRPTLWLLFGSVGLILLIASANVANLLLAQGVGRQREIAVRLALGARRSRVVRQLLTESTVLALFGGGLGLLVAVLAVRGVIELLPPEMPRLVAVGVDARVTTFAIGVALLTGWVVSVAPALRLGSVTLGRDLEVGGRAFTAGGRARRLVVVAEIAMTVVLLVGSGLLVKSFWRLSRTDPGIRADGLVTFFVGAEHGYLESFDAARAFHRIAEERIAALPGVEGVSAISQAPYNRDGGVVGCRQFDETEPDADNEVRCRWRTVDDDYFEVTGTRLLEGRTFGPDDGEGAEPVAVLSRATARRLFPDGALGGRIATGFESAVDGGLPWATVVGVVADVRFLGLAEESPLLVYRPVDQTGSISEAFGFYGRDYVVRGRPGAAGMEAVRGAVQATGPAGVVARHRSMGDMVRASVDDRRAILLLMSTFALAAFTLGIVGVYGVVAQGVRSQSRELSIRRALGATPRAVVAQVLAAGMRVCLGGAAAGLVLAIWLARFMDAFLYEVEADDPWVVAAALVLTVAVSLVSVWMPARRGAGVDPVAALAAE